MSLDVACKAGENRQGVEQQCDPATFVASKAGKVQLRKANGKLITLPISQLSDTDQQWIKERQAEIRKLNEQGPSGKRTPAASKTSRSAGGLDIAQAFEPFAKLNAIKYRSDERYFYVESNGMPDHPMMVGITAWQQQVPLPQKYFGDNAWQIPLHPVPAAEPASANGRFLRGAIALAVNGIPIFNPLNNRGDDAYLFGELDEYGGHCGRADDYHYHIAPVHLEKQVGKGSIIAYALDGYPIYGYDEPDGSKVGKLDWLNGHKDADGHYHYHSSKTYPYLNGGFYGEVTELDGQVDPQPRAQPVREGLPPLQGAKIVGFTSTKPNSYKLTYDINGSQGFVNYTIAATGSVEFTFTDPSGRSSTETYTPRGQGGGGARGGERRSHLAIPGENQMPRGGQRPPSPGDQPSLHTREKRLHVQIQRQPSAVDGEQFRARRTGLPPRRVHLRWRQFLAAGGMELRSQEHQILRDEPLAYGPRSRKVVLDHLQHPSPDHQDSEKLSWHRHHGAERPAATGLRSDVFQGSRREGVSRHRVCSSAERDCLPTKPRVPTCSTPSRTPRWPKEP